jgi:transcriptional regulator with AAA-type ATPase domain
LLVSCNRLRNEEIAMANPVMAYPGVPARLSILRRLPGLPGFESIVGSSAALGHVLHQVEMVAPTTATVLISGETGTGKELIARAIHDLSPRVEGTLVRLNCVAIPSGLLESELFGHERGAFTGATAQRIGRFELASNGTMFLDEAGEVEDQRASKLGWAGQIQRTQDLAARGVMDRRGGTVQVLPRLAIMFCPHDVHHVPRHQCRTHAVGSGRTL